MKLKENDIIPNSEVFVLEGGEPVKKINKDKQVEIYTDSKYVKLGITEWIHKWKKNNWQTSKKENVKNKELWVELYELTKSFEISWIWVKAHAGNVLNEEVDLLAKNEAESNKI